MPQTLSMIVALAMAVSVTADPPTLKLPAEVRGEPGDPIAITAETTGKLVRWVPVDRALKLFPAGLLCDKKATVVWANKPGRYRLLAYTALGDEPSEPAIVTIVIEGAAPPIPPEPPAPGPSPPPGPTPPGPVDPLTKKIRDALASDPGAPAEKAKHAAALAGFYIAMADHVKAGIPTVGDLLSDYRAAIPSVLPDSAIPATRKAAGAEVAAIAGDDAEKSIDGTLKAKFVDLFTKLAKALEAK